MSKNLTRIFQGKTAVVTGGTRGIGKAIALDLASKGADILLSHRASDEEAERVVSQIEASGSKGVAFKGDLGDPSTARRIVERVCDTFGRLDILINNAGIAHLQCIGELGDWKDADRVWAINTMAVVNMIRAAGEVLAENGRIVTIGSVSGTTAGMPGASDYCGSKAAIAGFSRGAARDLAPRRITVNVVESGMMSTEMALGMPEADQARILSGIPLGRFGELTEISALVCFLASQEAAYITGATLTIDGGYSA